MQKDYLYGWSVIHLHRRSIGRGALPGERGITTYLLVFGLPGILNIHGRLWSDNRNVLLFLECIYDQQ